MFSESSGFPWSQVALTTIGVAFTTVGIWSAITSERLLKHGKTAKGRITRLVWSSGTSSGGAYYPEFSFTGQDGSTHVVLSQFGVVPVRFLKGKALSSSTILLIHLARKSIPLDNCG